MQIQIDGLESLRKTLDGTLESLSNMSVTTADMVMLPDGTYVPRHVFIQMNKDGNTSKFVPDKEQIILLIGVAGLLISAYVAFYKK